MVELNDPINQEIKRRARLKKKHLQEEQERERRAESDLNERKVRSDAPTTGEVVDSIVNKEKHNREEIDAFNKKLGRATLSKEQVAEAKEKFNPIQVYELYQDEFATIGKLFDYVYETDDKGNFKLFTRSDGEQEKIIKRDDSGKPLVKNVVKWDKDVQYDIKRGLEVYDAYNSGIGQRQAISDTDMVKDADLKKLAAIILSEAIEAKVSDFEILQYEHFGLVRFTQGPNSWYIQRLLYKSSVDPLITIFKDMAGMKIKIADARKPQTNGKIVIHGKNSNATTNFRVAANSNQYGMTIDLRRQGVTFGSLDDLNFPPLIKSEFRRSLRAKDGLIIIGGPVGSGKSTLMDAGMIERLRETNGAIKVVSLEKPVEKDIPGIVQRDIDDEYGISWSSAIQTALREAPTILRVGEVNEKPAADAIVRAANSGIIALTTMHIKSALEVFETLKSYQVSENDIKNSLRLVIYLNRVPRLCPHCRKEESLLLHEEDNQWIKRRLKEGKDEGEAGVLAYRNPEGCEYCRANQPDKSLYGTLGKIGIYELLRVNKPLLRIWRMFSDKDVYVLRDMLMHPERAMAKFIEDTPGADKWDEKTKQQALIDLTSGLLFEPLQKDIYEKLKSKDIDIETARYLLNE